MEGRLEVQRDDRFQSHGPQSLHSAVVQNMVEANAKVLNGPVRNTRVCMIRDTVKLINHDAPRNSQLSRSILHFQQS